MSHLISSITYADGLDESLEDEGHGHGEDGAAGGDDAVDDAHVPAEVVAEDDERRRVAQRRPAPEQKPVRHPQTLNLKYEQEYN